MGRPFSISDSRIDIDDVLLSRYGDYEYILAQPVQYVLKLYQKAIIEQERTELYQLYLVHLPNAKEGKRLSWAKFYEEFRTMRFEPKVEMSTKSADEIMAESLRIADRVKKQKRKE